MGYYDFSTPASYYLDPRGLATAESERYDDLESEYEATLKELRRLDDFVDEEEILAEFGSEEAFCERIAEVEDRLSELSSDIEWMEEHYN